MRTEYPGNVRRKNHERGILDRSDCFAFTDPEGLQDLLFYVTWLGHYYCNEHYSICRNTYPAQLVMYVQNGEMKVVYRGKKEVAKKGDLVLLDCTEPHEYSAGDGLEFYYFHFNGSNSRSICRKIIEEQGWLIRKKNNAFVRDQIADMLRFYKEGGIESPMDISMRIYKVFQILASQPAETSASESWVNQSIHYIREHISEDIKLSDIADHVNLSVYYFSHIFKDKTGMSPHNYVVQCRIERAKALLISTVKPVADIAYEVGYASSGSMINSFQKNVGVSPNQYRKQYYQA